MRETAQPATGKPGRCAHHPGVAAVGSCGVCGRSLCMACAVPVRGALIGPECLSTILDPGSLPPPPPASSRAAWLATAGFGLVVALTVLPWSRFGEGSRILGAWATNWALLSAAAGLAGFAFALFARYRRVDARVETAAYAGLAVGVAGGALLHVVHPPLLSEASAAPLVALLGAAVALLGAVVKARALAAGRPVA